MWLSDIYTLNDALVMIRQVGELVAKPAAASQLTEQITNNFAQLRPLTRPLRIGYFIWQKPFMAAGQHTFIHDMLARCGFANAFATVGNGRYPELTPQQIRDAKPDAIFLSSEPFPFAEKHRQAVSEMFPGTAVHLVDGELFSWYGSRLLKAPAYFQQLIDRL
jgi:ABC-type Fe3+-hydroxamate transport system substrate-binding protein